MLFDFTPTSIFYHLIGLLAPLLSNGRLDAKPRAFQSTRRMLVHPHSIPNEHIRPQHHCTLCPTSAHTHSDQTNSHSLTTWNKQTPHTHSLSASLSVSTRNCSPGRTLYKPVSPDIVSRHLHLCAISTISTMSPPDLIWMFALFCFLLSCSQPCDCYSLLFRCALFGFFSPSCRFAI